MSDDARDDLAPFASALAASIERALASRGSVPDVDDTLARAEAIAPRRVPPSMRAALAELVHVVPLARGRGSIAVDAELTPFATALREQVEQQLHTRGLAAIPPAPAHRRRWPIVVGAVAAAAAAVVAFATLGGSELLRDETVTEVEQAERIHEAASPEGAARVREDVSRRAIERAAPARDGEAVRPMSPPTAAPQPSSTAAPERPQSLQALAAAAEAAWKRGQLVEAERIYRRIVALGGRGRHADLAYGDLFAIARQLGGADDQAALWREYLRRFPRGRFAEDARAGLCRRATGAARVRCWGDYLGTHPEGTHADEARRARDGASK